MQVFPETAIVSVSSTLAADLIGAAGNCPPALPADYYDVYPQEIGAVTADQIRGVMDKYVRDDQMTIVVVAPAAQVKSQLEKLGTVDVIAMPAKPKGGILGQLLK